MAKAPKKRTYQQMSDELAGLVEWFESDNVNLDQAVDKYQQALRILEEMEDFLKTAENKLKKITQKFTDD